MRLSPSNPPWREEPVVVQRVKVIDGQVRFYEPVTTWPAESE
jgi:hypothetical protein